MGNYRDGIIVSAVAFLIVTIVLLSPISPIDDSDITGLAIDGFSDPINTFTFNDNIVSASDSAIYKYGYYSIDGAPWQQFALNGNALGGNWLTGTATKTLPNFGPGEHYIVIYSCTRVSGAWNCHGNMWQIKVVNNPVTPNPTCTLGTNTNCAYCGNTCTSTLTCNNGQCMATSKGTGKTYYVSSSTGKDEYTGLSESAPWQTLTKVNSMNFQPGDTILFKRGDTFRGYLYINDNGSPGNPITFDAYGTGAKPRLWGSKDYSSSSLWTQHSGNIWRTTTAPTTAGDVANLIFNNEASSGFKKTSITSFTAQGDWYIDPSTSQVYLYSTSNPGNYYSHIEIGGAYIGNNIEEVVKIDSADYITIRNLDVRYSPNNGIIFMYGCTNGIVEYCDVSWIGGMYVAKTPPYRMGNGIGVWVDASNITIRYNRVNQCYDAGISPQGGTGYTQKNIQMYYNVISNTWYCYETWAEAGAVMDDVNFYNNVCVDTGSQWSANQRPDKNNAHHVMIWTVAGTVTNSNIKNNIFKTSVNQGIRWDDANSEFRFDNNLYDTNTLALTNYGTYTTLAQWQSATGQDIHSISGNPLFMSSSNYNLQSGSPAINRGVNVGLTRDYNGNAIVGLPDIGAFEYSGTTQSTCIDGIQNQGETGIDCGGPCSACASYLRTFYVSSSTGSDSNSGTSPSTPWKTINHVNSQTFRAGDGILFKRGDTWREQLIPDSGSSSGRITYGSYGNGVKPKLLGSVDCTSGWTNVGTNLWQNSNSALNVDVGNLIFNNEQSCGTKQLSSSSPTLDSQGEFWYDPSNYRVRLYSVGNPSTVYSHIECALKRNIIGYGAASYVTIENLDLRYGAAHGIGFHSGTNQITVKNCDISYIGGGDFSDSTGYVRYGNGIEFWESASNIIVENCRVDNIYDAAITTQGQSGGRTLSNAYINNNTISNSEYSFEYWFRDSTSTANNVFFENNTCTNAGHGFGHNQRPDSINGRHLMISQNSAKTSNVFIRYNTLSEATESLIRVTDPPGTANVIIDYNRLHQSSGYIGELGWGSNNKYSTLNSWQQASGKDAHSVMI